MRGAPQVGFSATVRKIKARASLLTRFRPPTWLTLETHVQYKRNPARCQFTNWTLHKSSYKKLRLPAKWVIAELLASELSISGLSEGRMVTINEHMLCHTVSFARSNGTLELAPGNALECRYIRYFRGGLVSSKLRL